MILHHKIIGKGDPLFIIHGLFGSLDNWSTLARRFSETRKVILVDQRNHGHSFHADEMDYDLMAGDLVALMDHLEIDKADLLGHSMGGKTVMRIAMIHPERIERLIVADIGPDDYESHHDLILEALFSLGSEEMKSRSAAQAKIRELIQNEGIVQFLTKNLYWKEKGKLAWRMNLPVLADHMEEILGSIGSDTYSGPTLFIRGGKSDYIQDQDLMGIHIQFRDSEVETIEEAGHWLHAEKPKDFYEIVEGFLS